MDESSTNPELNNPADEMLSPVKKVSKRKIVYSEIDDEITTVYEQVKNLPIDEVYVVVPPRAVLFTSIVNLKILKHKLADIGKKLSIITSDRVGTKLAHQAGISVYDHLEQAGKKPILLDSESPKLKISPLTASKNVFEDDSPKKLSERKISINDIVKTNKESSSAGAMINRLKDGLAKQKRLTRFFKNYGWPKFSNQKMALGSLIVVSFFVLLLISYIALPGVTLYISPGSNMIEKSLNVILLEKAKHEVELSSHPRSTLAVYALNVSPITINLTYAATGTIFKGANAEGELTIINKRRTPWQLVTKTRFQTKDGLVFRISKGVTVPAATAAADGTLTVPVKADEYDVYGKVLGERGNIGPTSFFLPGLNQTNQQLLFAQSKGEMSGGKTQVIKTVTKQDTEAALNKAKQDILGAIVPTLEKKVAAMNAQEKIDYMLVKEDQLQWQRAIKYSEPRISIPADLIGKEQDIFTITAAVDARGIAYKKSELLAILKAELQQRKSPEKILTRIEDDSVSYLLFESDMDAGQYKMTATIKGIEEYDLDPTKENGLRLISKIKEHILGKDIKEAHDYIQNLPEIHTVEIKSWPIWAPTIPTVMDNIEVKIVRE